MLGSEFRFEAQLFEARQCPGQEYRQKIITNHFMSSVDLGRGKLSPSQLFDGIIRFAHLPKVEGVEGTSTGVRFFRSIV